ncbi:hypothetical protein KCP73_08900 [Salmonella enterica subsp. enterica]|nr:hypothetical protein KCP73_08900 [Salmonella enterica subsp. enterica]
MPRSTPSAAPVPTQVRKRRSAPECGFCVSDNLFKWGGVSRRLCSDNFSRECPGDPCRKISQQSDVVRIMEALRAGTANQDDNGSEFISKV